MHFGLTYKATNTINGKTYVGKTTKTLKYRWKRHIEQPIRVFGKAIAKYGPDAFVLEILEIIGAHTVEHLQLLLNESERKFIANFDCRVPNGYNLTDGGDGAVGYKHTSEAHEKMRQAQLGNKKCLGRKRPPHEIEAMRQRNLGKKLSPEHVEKMRQYMKGRRIRTDYTVSPETREKIRAAKLGKKLSPEHAAKIGDANRGKKRPGYKAFWSEESRKAVGQRFKGKPLSPEHRQKIKDSLRKRFARG